MSRRSLFIGFVLGSTSVFVYILTSTISECINGDSGILVYNVEEAHGQLQRITNCSNKHRPLLIKQRGNYLVLYNFVRAAKEFQCHETITLTAPGDYRFLDNVAPLVEGWQGPISIALYAPGFDFQSTLDSIAYVRNCQTSLIKDLVTFHVFFENQHIPQVQTLPLAIAYKDEFDCEQGPPFSKIPDEDLYKSKKKLTYPINVARNIARETATTHFVFPSDIELFPTPNFIEQFLEMVERKESLFTNRRNKVFALPVFEVLEDQEIPKTKGQLQHMFKEGTAMLFHETICWKCHKVPKGDEWLAAEETQELDVFAVGKRQGKNVVWEPFYVCTNKEPMFDERLSWEGQSNKMSQAYSLCLLNYEFMVLNNAFLTHKPGVKKKKVQVEKHLEIINGTKKVLRTIRDELSTLYGPNKNCIITYNID